MKRYSKEIECFYREREKLQNRFKSLRNIIQGPCERKFQLEFDQLIHIRGYCKLCAKIHDRISMHSNHYKNGLYRTEIYRESYELHQQYLAYRESIKSSFLLQNIKEDKLNEIKKSKIKKVKKEIPILLTRRGNKLFKEGTCLGKICEEVIQEESQEAYLKVSKDPLGLYYTLYKKSWVIVEPSKSK